MNPLVTLLVAAAATGADPQPVVQQTVSPVSSYTYTTEDAPDSRPGFLGRIRNALGSKSSSTSTGTYSSQGYQVGTPTVISTTTAVPSAPRFVTSDSSREPPLADSVPVTTPAPVPQVRPVTPAPVVTQPTYTYPAPSAASSSDSNSRVRFPRLRKLFGGSSSQPSQALPEDVIVTPQVAAPVAPPAPAPIAPVIQGQPQRLPIGNP
jgi:hypothetical protein